MVHPRQQPTARQPRHALGNNGRDIDFNQEILCRQPLYNFGFGKFGRAI
jgi:hypothetical protein